jgi:hypothetical protein
MMFFMRGISFSFDQQRPILELRCTAYQISFKANCICREGVEVAFKRPALEFGSPLTKKTWRFPGNGGLKFA